MDDTETPETPRDPTPERAPQSPPEPQPAPAPQPPPEPEPAPEAAPGPEKEEPRLSARERRTQRAARVKRNPFGQVRRGTVLKGGVVLGVVVLIAAGVWGSQQLPEPHKSVHWHAAFEVFVEGNQLSFMAPAYDLSGANYMRGHLHNQGQGGNDDVVHIEGLSGLTCGLWFENGLNAKMTDKSIQFNGPPSNGAKYENNATGSWKLYVHHQGTTDWALISKMSSYQPKQKDRLLFTYGSEPKDELQFQFDAVLEESRIPT